MAGNDRHTPAVAPLGVLAPQDAVLDAAFGFRVIGTRLYRVVTDDRGDLWLELARDATKEEQAMYRWLSWVAGQNAYGAGQNRPGIRT